MKKDKKIILFDGICNLCNGAVIFIIKRDKKDLFRFAALQSEIGRDLVEKYDIDTDKTESIILIDNEKYFTKSSAALGIAKHLSGGYPLLYLFKILPGFVRDRMYDVIANNRYKWFGKRESCMIPTDDLNAKFLSD